MPVSKEERKSIGISAMASIVGMSAIVLPVGWYLVKPAVAKDVAAELSATVETTVQKKLAPLNVGFKAILQQNIDRLRREISVLENKQRAGALTDQEVRDLIDKRIDLDGQIDALAGIREAEAQ
jgi:hypothetical protein